MKKYIALNVLLIIAVSIFASIEVLAYECRCHSKNPAMRRMHEMIGFKNCGDCHSKAENLMKKKSLDKGKEEHKDKLNRRIKEDSFCFPCHNSNGTIKLDTMQITNSFYCPKDKLRFSKADKVCPKCGAALININELMENSKQRPSNKICRQCHLNKDVQAISAHIDINRKEQYNCLSCHVGHDDCASCHH